MRLSRLTNKLFGWLGRPLRSEHSGEAKARGPRTHVIILDGTLSSLEPGFETHAGMTYRFCREMGAQVSVFYEAGVQWDNWRSTVDVMLGRGINRQIRRAYGYLASRYRPGDRIFLFGYSRGAFAVRSLAGMIDMVGLLRTDQATVRSIRNVYRHYQYYPLSLQAEAFKTKFCHPDVPVEMIGVWDTVKALGLKIPLLRKGNEDQHAFHNHQLGHSIRNGFQALALDETRRAYLPELWYSEPGFPGRVEQVWFRGAHGDIGGHISGFERARPLSNISLVWMLEKAEECGLPLPRTWKVRLFTDPDAPSVGTWRGWGKIFWIRTPRVIGRDPTESIHPSVRPEMLPRGALISLRPASDRSD